MVDIFQLVIDIWGRVVEAVFMVIIVKGFQNFVYFFCVF